MIKNLSILTVCLFVLVACSVNQTKNKQNPTLLLEPRMTKEQVISVLGLPYKKRAKGKVELYEYYIQGAFSVCFDENGKLASTAEYHNPYCKGLN